MTSTVGAKTAVKPTPRSSAPEAAAARRVRSGSSAAPRLMNVGNRVRSPLARSTRPPSWSTPRKTGHGRPASSAASLTAAFSAASWSVVRSGSMTMMPPRCWSATRPTGGVAPRWAATMTCPAFSSRVRSSTSLAASSSADRSGSGSCVVPPASAEGVGAGTGAGAGAGSAVVPGPSSTRVSAGPDVDPAVDGAASSVSLTAHPATASTSTAATADPDLTVPLTRPPRLSPGRRPARAAGRRGRASRTRRTPRCPGGRSPA